MSRSNYARKNVPPEAFDNACRGKVGYTSKRQAKGVARVMMQKGRLRRRMNSYKCTCGKWHNGGTR